MSNQFEPKILAYCCQWCSYAAADLAGVSRLSYSANFRAVRIPRTGRMSPKLILHTFCKGVDGVWVSGSHPGETATTSRASSTPAAALPCSRTYMRVGASLPGSRAQIKILS